MGVPSTVKTLSDETESEKLRQEMFDRYEQVLHLKVLVLIWTTAVRKFSLKWSIREMAVALCANFLLKGLQKWVLRFSLSHYPG